MEISFSLIFFEIFLIVFLVSFIYAIIQNSKCDKRNRKLVYDGMCLKNTKGNTMLKSPAGPSE